MAPVRGPGPICRIDRPTAMRREISSRSSSLSAAKALRRGAGTIPPWSTTIRSTPVLFFLSSAREMAAALCPFFHHPHSSAFCAAVNQIHDLQRSDAKYLTRSHAEGSLLDRHRCDGVGAGATYTGKFGLYCSQRRLCSLRRRDWSHLSAAWCAQNFIESRAMMRGCLTLPS